MDTETELSRIPVLALQSRTREALSSRLNERKVLCSPNKLQRDYRGLADCMGVKLSWSPRDDFVGQLLHLWYSNNREEATLGKLCQFLERIDRFDVLEDICDWFDEDAREYQRNILPITLCDERMFDAFVLYIDADVVFAQMIIHDMKAAQIRVCDKNQNIPPGEIELRAIHRIIEQCRTFIVIFSKESLQDESFMNVFYFAWSLCNNRNTFPKRIIPCVYEKDCILPKDILSLVRLDFTRYDQNEFLSKLRQSVARSTDANHADPRLLINTTSSQNGQLEPSMELNDQNGSSELSLSSESSDSEIDNRNRVPRQSRSRSNRLLVFLLRFTSRRRRQQG